MSAADHVTIYDVTSGRIVGGFPASVNGYADRPAAAYPDGRLLAVSQPGGNVAVHALPGGERVAALKGGLSYVEGLEFNRAGRLFFRAVKSYRRFGSKPYYPRRQEYVWRPGGSPPGVPLSRRGGGAVWSSPDGDRWLESSSRYADANASSVIKGHTRTGRTVLLRAAAGKWSQVRFSPCRRYVAVSAHPYGFSNGQKLRSLQLFDARTGRPILARDDAKPYRIEFSTDGRVLAAVLLGDSPAAGRVELIETATGGVRHRLIGHRGPPRVRFAPGGRYLIAVSGDAPIFVWDTRPAVADPPAREKLWGALAAADAAAAYRAMRGFMSHPTAAKRFLRAKLADAAAKAADATPGLVKRLGSASPADRRAASRALARLPRAAVPLPRAELKRAESAEVAARLRRVLGQFDRSPSVDPRAERASEILAWIDAGQLSKDR